jgi:hypothetical protein
MPSKISAIAGVSIRPVLAGPCITSLATLVAFCLSVAFWQLETRHDAIEAGIARLMNLALQREPSEV